MKWGTKPPHLSFLQVTEQQKYEPDIFLEKARIILASKFSTIYQLVSEILRRKMRNLKQRWNNN
jgi:hypothetical protein